MKITSLECWIHEMPLQEAYTIAYESVDKCQNVFLKIQTNNNITGFGCAAPDMQVTSETADGVSDSFKNTIEPVLKGSNPFKYIRLIEQLKHRITNQPSALAMVDMALYDIVSQKAGVPLYQFLGGYRDSIATSITIGILPVDGTVEKAKNYLKNGFSILKIKGGINVSEDIERILKVRAAVGKKVEIRFDANQGYSVEEAVQFITETKSAKIELLEQPTDRSNEELLGQVSRKVPVPVMADESLMTLKDVFRLTSKERTDMINIKLMKVGGISEALHINSVARSAGVEVMVGCMDESALAIAAGLHFALARPNVIYADLDGHLDLIDDPFAGIFKLENGVLYPSENAGLGIAV